MSLLFRIYPGIKAYQFLFTFSNRKWADQECLQILKIIMAKQWAYKKYLLLISFFSNTFIPFHNTTVCIRNCANDLEIFAFNLLIPMATLFLLLSQYFSSLWLLEWPQEWTVVFPPTSGLRKFTSTMQYLSMSGLYLSENTQLLVLLHKFPNWWWRATNF